MGNTIKLKSFVDSMEELVANAAITPGMILGRMSTNKVRAHATAGGNAKPVMVACEDELQGKGIGDNYAAADQVQVWFPVPGDTAWLILADGEDVTRGDLLESNGAGYLQKHTPDVDAGGSADVVVADMNIYTEQVIGQALETIALSSSSALESSGEGTVDATIGYARRIKVKIL